MYGVKRNGVAGGVEYEQVKKRVKHSVDGSEDEAEEGSSDEDEELESDEEDEGSEDEGSEDESDDDRDSSQDPNLFTKEQKLLSMSREISSAIKNDRAKATREGGLDQARELLEKINAAFEERKRMRSSNKTIEVYDSRNLVDGGDLMDIAIRNIKVGTSGGVLNIDDFTRRMKTYLLKNAIQYDNDDDDDPENYYGKQHEFRKFNWFQFGTFLYSRGRKAPTTSHLLGPLEIEKKIRQFKARTDDKPVGRLVTAEKVSGDDINGQSINQTPNSVQECFKIFHQKSQGAEINIFKFFINPRSFSQSIENMFFTSFLIRDGRLQLGEDEEGYPTIAELPPLPSDPREKETVLLERRNRPSNHIIFELEYASWKNLIEKLNITESYLPNRPEEEN